MIRVGYRNRPHRTMERPTKVGNETEEKFEQEYKDLVEKFESVKQPKPGSLRRSLTDSITIEKGLHLIETSPRKLMSSLQRGRMSPSGAWKVRNNDLAAFEIWRERKAAIESGKLKGRRLFDAAENVSSRGGIQEIICNDNWDDLVQEISEVRSLCFYDSDDEKENIVESKQEILHPVYCSASSLSSTSSSYLCDTCKEKEIMAVEGEKEVEGSEDKKKRGVKDVKSWLAIAIGLIVVCVFSMTSFIVDTYSHGNKVILVPT